MFCGTTIKRIVLYCKNMHAYRLHFSGSLPSYRPTFAINLKLLHTELKLSIIRINRILFIFHIVYNAGNSK